MASKTLEKPDHGNSQNAISCLAPRHEKNQHTGIHRDCLQATDCFTGTTEVWTGPKPSDLSLSSAIPDFENEVPSVPSRRRRNTDFINHLRHRVRQCLPTQGGDRNIISLGPAAVADSPNFSVSRESIKKTNIGGVASAKRICVRPPLCRGGNKIYNQDGGRNGSHYDTLRKGVRLLCVESQAIVSSLSVSFAWLVPESAFRDGYCVLLFLFVVFTSCGFLTRSATRRR